MLLLPSSSTILGADNHSFMHRVVAIDNAAPEQSIIVNPDGSINLASVSAGGLLKTDNTGKISIASAGTDYLTPSGSGASLSGITTSQVSESGNLYFTNARAISAMAGLYESPLTFSNGVTRVSNSITNDLSTGVIGGQNVVGGVNASDSLTLVSTTNATKGFIYFGAAQNAFYDTANQYFQVNTNGAGVTQTLTSGTWYQNNTAAAAGAQQISPSIVLEGQGWGTTAGTSQSTKFQLYVLPVQSTVPTANLLIQSSVNGAAFTTAITITSSGVITAVGAQLSSVNNSIYAPSTTGVTHSTTAQFLYAGGAGVGVRNGFYGSTSTVLTANDNYAQVVFAGSPITRGTSGAHAWLSQAVFQGIGTVTSGTGTVTNTATIYVVGASAAGGTGNYSIYVASGTSYFGGNLGLGVLSASVTAVLHLKSGTASAGTAPIKLSSGTVMTTGEAGAMEYDGTNLFFTRTGTTRESVLTGNSGAGAPSTSVGVTIANYYGSSATNFLGTPNSWAGVNIGGVAYKIPLYT